MKHLVASPSLVYLQSNFSVLSKSDAYGIDTPDGAARAVEAVMAFNLGMGRITAALVIIRLFSVTGPMLSAAAHTELKKIIATAEAGLVARRKLMQELELA